MRKARLLTGEQLLMLFFAAAVLLAVGKVLEWRTAAVQLSPVHPTATTTPTP